jgi:hypothetical protein
MQPEDQGGWRGESFSSVSTAGSIAKLFLWEEEYKDRKRKA